jgi:hypothetical protein
LYSSIPKRIRKIQTAWGYILNIKER